MPFTLKHIIELPNGNTKEHVVQADEILYKSVGEEHECTGTLYYGADEDRGMLTKELSGVGRVYVVNEGGKTVAAYHLGYHQNEKL